MVEHCHNIVEHCHNILEHSHNTDDDDDDGDDVSCIARCIQPKGCSLLWWRNSGDNKNDRKATYGETYEIDGKKGGKGVLLGSEVQFIHYRWKKVFSFFLNTAGVSILFSASSRGFRSFGIAFLKALAPDRFLFVSSEGGRQNSDWELKQSRWGGR